MTRDECDVMGKIGHRPAERQLAYTFGGRIPVAHLRSGDVLEVYTEDCFGGRLRSATDLSSWMLETPHLNPVSGPFLIEEAEPGDTLAIHIVSVVPARDWGVSSTPPHIGALGTGVRALALGAPVEARVWFYEIDRRAGTVRFQSTRTDHAVDLPLEPTIGTIGVSPGRLEARSTMVPDFYGGKLDIPEARAGATLYLGVNVHGAMLALGDGHARQGHGQACPAGVAIATVTTVAIEVIKGWQTSWPRLETDLDLMSIGCARPLDDAYRIAHQDLVSWVGSLAGLEMLDAHQLVSQAGRTALGNVRDANYTLLAAIGRRLVPHPAAAYDDAHDRLKRTAASAG
ncbi:MULTISPECIES: acetamidase/formamidase family protein [Micromonospora]|nr:MULTISPECIES: acetamidase/formamidase family protein [Micromonospora]